jgi:DNA polymerase I
MELRFDPENPKYTYITNMVQSEEALSLLEKEKVVGVDIESTTLDPYEGYLLIIQIGTATESFIFDARALDLANYKRFKDFLQNRAVIKILHNGKFDYKYVKQKTGIEIDNIFDTMLTEAILNAGIGKAYYGLKDLALKYTGIAMEKDVRKSFVHASQNISLTETQLKYGAIDTLILFPIFEQQAEHLRKENLLNIAKLEYAVTRVVGDMELTGIFLDAVKWREIIVVLQEKRNLFASQFQEAVKPFYNASTVDLFGNSVNVINQNSNAQLLDLFNNKLKLNIPSTGDAILALMDHPIAKILRDYRGYEKLISAFGESLLEKINKKTGRIHPEFNQLGAATGRFSCNNPNLQQIPRNSKEAPFRECFNPKPGYKLVVADYSSMEMRVLAELSGDAKLIQAVMDSDVHSFTASLMFNKEYSKDFKKLYPELRQAAKTINFGLMYGMGPSSLARQIGVTPEVGKEYMERYFKNFPSVQKFLDTMAKNAVKNGWSATPAGRKRWYHKPDPSDPEYKKKNGQIEREAKNHPIQGTNADCTKYALVFLNERLKKEGVDGAITHTVHDEIVSEIREDQAQDWAQVQSAEMVRAAKLFIHKVDVKSDPFVGDVWEH